ncbi:hypothetical protein P691DRAFT_813372 [Macrolepiota fuliginosa MF-IS2]|uniref:Smr domain-containing protein n=1 Tax=Macrolepiota fuliginosa MF-IS2 TaxID=1400762 RepID=A0A9P6C576_9AGAR|nr:hypothetical protein P691DRAFT_813372 [Macrolepiota fuliginosa MF-IS2]
MSTLFKTLEKEFCPPLDSSLLAAMLAEVESDSDGKPLSPLAPEVDLLCHTLRELAAHADAAQLSEFVDLNLMSPTEDTISSQDFGFSGTTGDTSLSSQSSSGSSDHPFSSPLGFLQAALPDVRTNALKKALKDAERDGREDMWDIIGNILSAEWIRELEERGLDALDESDGVFREEDVEWGIATSKSRKSHRPTPLSKRKHARATKIALFDVRQQNHGPSRREKPAPTTKPPLPDLWTQVSSIATHVATYLTPHPASFFLSYLHSPKYRTPYQALCDALEALSRAEPSRDPDTDTVMLSNILDIILPEYESLDSEQRSRLIYDTDLCIRATNGRGDDVLDMVKLLRELDSDASSGRLELGIYHLPPQKPPPPPIITADIFSKRASLPPLSPSTPRVPLKPPSPSASTIANTAKNGQSDSYQWQSVPVRKVAGNGPHPLAQSIPAYARIATNGRRVKGNGNGFGKGGKGDVGELPQGRIREHRRKQEEYLRQAAKMWQRGDKKSRGGEIAFYYAEKAREFQEMAKQEALENARIMVDSKRVSAGKYDEIDLHGTTVFEAVTIVKEILQDFTCSPSQPLKIITGKGSHSANGVAVLKPAIRNSLVEDGWIVGTWDAGLVVRGRNH